MKKRKRSAGRKARTSRRKPIMRHSREGARPRKGRPKKQTAKAARKRVARRATPARAKSAPRPKKTAKARTGRRRGAVGASFEPLPDERGMGAEAGGQSGDTESLS